ncbi:hypothetical protein [Acidovorax delafieldii]|uniref:hypothetical protein n=1 Tax=Acidovorax delafieldii TaxID=47920 RepID=UPI003F509574
MASGFSESGDGLHYAEHISVPMRIFVGAIALGMFLIPVPFVMHATARTPWLHLLLAAACVVAACAMVRLISLHHQRWWNAPQKTAPTMCCA